MLGELGHAVAVPGFSKCVPHLHTLFYCGKIVFRKFIFSLHKRFSYQAKDASDTYFVPHSAMSEVVNYVVEHGIPIPKEYSSTLC